MDSEYVKVYGKLVDFNNNLLPGADVKLLSDKFEILYSDCTDENGKYEMKIKKAYIMHFMHVRIIK